ncbi:hypothetical protein QTP88_007214 [Uroleucon formosanum]
MKKLKSELCKFKPSLKIPLIFNIFTYSGATIQLLVIQLGNDSIYCIKMFKLGRISAISYKIDYKLGLAMDKIEADVFNWLITFLLPLSSLEIDLATCVTYLQNSSRHIIIVINHLKY